MIALYRVPEPDHNLSSPFEDATLQQLWKITLHNFSPSPVEFSGIDPKYGWELVVMNHRPQYLPAKPPSTSLTNFVHPRHAIYMIGPNGRNMTLEDIPQHLEKIRRHHVHIPTDSLHSAFGHVVWSILFWDRMMKAARD